MPLHLNEQNESPEHEPSVPEPLLHKPKQYRSVGRTIGLVVSGIVVLAAIGFLVYVFSTRQASLSTREETTPNPQTVDTSVVHIPSRSQQAAQSTSPTTESTPLAANGKYTVYIGSLIDSESAADEVGRWNKAGYKAYVIHANGHYRVALGQFDGVRQAKNEAEQLKDAFEYGYWIGMIE